MSKYCKILLIIYLCLVVYNVRAQNELLIEYEKFEKEELINILKKLDSTYQVKFAYDVDKLKGKLITTTITNESLISVLGRLTNGLGIKIELIDNTYIFVPIKNSVALRFSGQVVDKQTGETLPYSNVYIPEIGKGTTSNSDGFFSFSGSTCSECVLIVDHLGYTPVTVHLFGSIMDVPLKIELESEYELLSEVVVNDGKAENIRLTNEVGHVEINPQKLKYLPVYGERDIFRMIQLLPGISATNEVSSGLVIRGGTPDQNLVMFDGYSLYHIDHFYGAFSAFNSDAIKNVEVYKSNMLAKYGGRVGGVVDITGKTGNKKKASGNIGANFITANAMLSSPIGDKVTLFLAGRRSYSDIIQSHFYNNLTDNVVSNGSGVDASFNSNDTEKQFKPKFSFYDFNGKLTYTPTEKDVLMFSYYSGKDKLNLSYNDSMEEFDSLFFQSTLSYHYNLEARWGNNGIGGRWARQWNKKWYSNISIGMSTYFSDIIFDENFSYRLTGSSDFEDFEEGYTYSFSQNNAVKDYTVKLELEWMPNLNHEILTGVSNTSNSIDFNFYVEEYSEIENETGNQFSLYVQDKMKFGEALTLTLGLRNMYFDILGLNYQEPKVLLSYRPTGRWLIKGGYSENNQVINRVIRQEIYSNNPDFWVLSNNDIPSVNAKNWVVGSSYNGENIRLDVESYYRKSSGVVEYLQRVGNIHNEDVLGEFYLNEPIYFVGENYSKGIELLIEGKWGVLTGWGGYSLSSSNNLFNEVNNGIIFPSQNDQRHEVKIAAMLPVGKWQLSATWVYGSGRPYTIPLQNYSIFLPDSTEVELINYGRINGERLPAYHRMDVSANYDFNIGKINTTIGVNVFNIYNRLNVKYKKLVPEYYNEDTGEYYDVPKYNLVDVKLLGITPNLYLSIRF